MVIELQGDLGQRIKAIRLRLGKSQEAFGAMLNPAAPKSAVSKWENGKNAPNKKRLQKIAELGGVSVEYLINGYSFSNADIMKTLRYAPANLTKEEKQKFYAAQLEIFSRATERINHREQQERNQINKEQNMLAKKNLSVIEQQTYSSLLSLFNLIRIHGTDNQNINFGALINIMWQIAVGNIEYDKDDVLSSVDELLSSFPVKNDNHEK